MPRFRVGQAPSAGPISAATLYLSRGLPQSHPPGGNTFRPGRNTVLFKRQLFPLSWKEFRPSGKVFPLSWKEFRFSGKVFPLNWKVFRLRGTVFPLSWKVFRPAGKLFPPGGKLFPSPVPSVCPTPP
jgi:hypothetical protein